MSQTSYHANYNLHIFIYSIIITISFPCSINVLFGYTQFLILFCNNVFMENHNLDGFKPEICDLQEPARTFWYVIITTYLRTQFIIVFLPNIHYYVDADGNLHINCSTYNFSWQYTSHSADFVHRLYILFRMRG